MISISCKCFIYFISDWPLWGTYCYCFHYTGEWGLVKLNNFLKVTWLGSSRARIESNETVSRTHDLNHLDVYFIYTEGISFVWMMTHAFQVWHVQSTYFSFSFLGSWVTFSYWLAFLCFLALIGYWNYLTFSISAI